MAYRSRSSRSGRRSRVGTRTTRRVVSRRRSGVRSRRSAAPRRAQTVRIVVQSGGAATSPVVLSEAGRMMVPSQARARF